MLSPQRGSAAFHDGQRVALERVFGRRRVWSPTAIIISRLEQRCTDLTKTKTSSINPDYYTCLVWLMSRDSFGKARGCPAARIQSLYTILHSSLPHPQHHPLSADRMRQIVQYVVSRAMLTMQSLVRLAMTQCLEVLRNAGCYQLGSLVTLASRSRTRDGSVELY